MMFVLKVLFNFVAQPKNALRLMPSYWSSSSKISITLESSNNYKVTEIQRRDQILVLNFHTKRQIFNGLNTWLLGAVNKLSKNNRSIVMNTYNKIWKNISRQLKYAKNSPQETDYQSAIYEIITDSDYLGWPSDRVKREYPVQMGSIKKSDIVLLDSDLSPLIAIEVKLSNSASNGIEQLGSYMDRCEPRLVFGITIKDSFNLFYDENTGRSIHSIKDAAITASIDNPSDIDGIKLVELLYFQNFDVDILKAFCGERLTALHKKSERERRICEVSNILSGDSGNVLMRKAIQLYLKENNFIDEGEEDIVDEITENLYLTNFKKQLESKNNETTRSYKFTYKFIPSIEDFVEYLKSNICYRHYVLSDGRIETQKWASSGGITVQTVKPNITGTPFYRKNKTNIVEIILSPYEDPNRE